MGIHSRMKTVIFCVHVLSLLIQLTNGAPSSQAFRRTSKSTQWHHGLFESVRAGVQKSAHSLLHYRTETPLHVPLEINIVLVGFNGDGGYRYKMDSEELRWFMQRSFPSHRPACLETGSELEVEHDLTYTVLPVGGLELVVLEKEVSQAMAAAGERKNQADNSSARLYSVEATKVEPVLDRLYSYLFGQEATASSEKELERPAPTAIFILNLDKVRMDPQRKHQLGADGGALVKELSPEELLQQESGYTYGYTYRGGARTQVWVSHGRYAVVDVSAGPCSYGRLMAAEGTVGESRIPRVRAVVVPKPGVGTKEAPVESHDLFRGRLSTLIVSAIEHLFSPDVKFETLDVADRVLVAIIVLRNHRRFNILAPGHPYSVSLKEIEKEVAGMLQPGQEVVVVAGTHSLHEHERIAMALSSAIRSQSVQQATHGGYHEVKTHKFLDGALMVEEMRHSADMLAAGLLDLSSPSLTDSFFDAHVSAAEGEPGSLDVGILKKKPVHHSTILPVKKDWQPRDASKKRKRKRRRRAAMADSKLARSHGTRVIPVFVLSLSGEEEGLLMEEEGQLSVAHDSVVVVQSYTNKSIATNFITENERLEINPTSSQGKIIAGIASVLGGLASPSEKLAPRYRARREDWLWAIGHHPFGPFSNCSSLSPLLKDTMLRNAIYSRVDTALHGMRESLEAMEAFSDDFLRTPFGDPVAPPAESQTAAQQWLDKLYHDPKKLFHPIPHNIVERLESSLQDIEEQLIKLSGHLYDHELKEGHISSSSLLQYVEAFHEYVQDELGKARQDMRCCKVEHSVPMRSGQALVYAGILVAGFLVYFLVIFFSSPER